MSKSEITKRMERAVFKEFHKMGTYCAFEVSIGWEARERVDFMFYTTKGEFRCFELKASVSDFRSKAKHSFVGHYNYFLMPPDVFEQVKKEIPKGIGAYVFHQGNSDWITCKKPARRRELLHEPGELKGYMIRALSRDAEKYYSQNDDSVLDKLRRENAQLIRQINSRGGY